MGVPSPIMKKVLLITDGSCLGNPGPGGWACVLRFGGKSKELYGYAPRTTNNRMELMAAIQGLAAVKEPCEIEVTTDSEYVRHGITRWAVKWKRRHWWKKNRPVRNVDLWVALDHLNAQHRTTWIWTKGHAGHPDNTRCDLLAQDAAFHQISSWPDRRPHESLPLGITEEFIPPKPQLSLFDQFTLDSGELDDADDPG